VSSHRRFGGVCDADSDRARTTAAEFGEEISRASNEWPAPPLHFVQGSVLATCRHMLAAVRAGRAAETSGRDNLKTCALVEAAYQAAATGRAVEPVF
jgi:D-apiose dehydrogenase